ncbi:MAG: TraB family protein [Spirochaetaceae bacterium]|nr:MAG: TraB family protein [Spirochaetaceae bacterium]
MTSVFSNEKLSVEEMEKLKEKSLMNSMMEELSGFLPKVKEVLIDERDRYIASKLFQTRGEKIVAVLGAGHIEGVVKTLHKLEAREMEESVEDLEQIPKKNIVGQIIPWIIPVAVPALLVLGYFTKGVDTSMNGILSWIIATSASAGIGALIAFGHPLAILSAMVSAPITALLPVIGSGMVSGLVQYRLRKPQVTDFEGLQEDFNKFTGFYKNRILKVLWVFMLTNLCGSFGTIAGISLIGSLLGGA